MTDPRVVALHSGELGVTDIAADLAGPDGWGFPQQRRSDRWGITDPSSQRVQAAQKKIRFAESLHIAA